MSYRDDEYYIALEKLIQSAGVSVEYGKVPDDSIDGEIWARADPDSMQILMPDEDVFPDAATACKTLGHEMGHIITRVDSVDGDPVRRTIEETTCDLVGAYLFRLAELIAENEAEKIWR